MYQQKAIILGLGVTGLSVIRFLLKKKICVFATDNRKNFQSDAFDALKDAYPNKLFFISPDKLVEMIKEENFSFLATSPGVPLTNPLLEQAKKLNIEIVGDIELAMRDLGNVKRPIIGITGSNGKTTVVTFLTSILTKAKISTKAVGNIGNPILDELDENEDNALVVELSSFQLNSMSSSVFSHGAILNVFPNHLDYHGTFDEYLNAKMRLINCLKDDGILYLHSNLKGVINSKKALFFGSQDSDIYSDGMYVIYHGKKESLLPVKLQGVFTHDLDNFLIAFGIARDYGVHPELIIKAFDVFEKPPHRIQFIRSFKGIDFYDDSKGTNIEAVIRAIDSIPGKIHLIAGGVHKGFPYTPWCRHFSGKVSTIFAIGQAAHMIHQSLNATVPVKICKSLEEAVHEATNLAKSGESVLLSPGCSSYDMFKDYKERGIKFQEIVNSYR